MTESKLNKIPFVEPPFIENIYLCMLNEVPKHTNKYTFTIEITQTNGEQVTAKTDPTVVTSIEK